MLSSLFALSLSLGSLVNPIQDTQIDRIRVKGLTELGAYSLLNELTTKIGGRLSGSPEAARAVAWVEREMRDIGLQNIHQIPCMVPHWVRGKTEKASMVGKGALSISALGGSVATPKGGIEAEVVEVHSLEEAAELGERGKGRIVFFNRGFDPTLAGCPPASRPLRQ